MSNPKLGMYETVFSLTKGAQKLPLKMSKHVCSEQMRTPCSRRNKQITRTGQLISRRLGLQKSKESVAENALVKIPEPFHLYWADKAVLSNKRALEEIKAQKPSMQKMRQIERRIWRHPSLPSSLFKCKESVKGRQGSKKYESIPQGYKLQYLKD
jgi:hypothetical protein